MPHEDQDDRLRSNVFRSYFMAKDESLLSLWRLPPSKLLVFVSSTFTDTQDERNVILEKILPKLRQRGKEASIGVT